MVFEEDDYGKRVIIKYDEEYRYFIMIEYDFDRNWVHFQVFQSHENDWKYRDIYTITQPISVLEKNLDDTIIKVCEALDNSTLINSPYHAF